MARFGPGERKPSPLDELETSISAKAGGGRRRRPLGEAGDLLGPAALKLVGGALVVVLAMALLGTILLWRIAAQTADLDERGGSRGAGAVEPPPLPPASAEGSSSRALARELDRLSTGMSSELQSVAGQLAGLSGLADVSGGVRKQLTDGARTLDQLAAQAAKFSGAPRKLGQLTASAGRLDAMQPALSKVASSTNRLRAVQDSLAAMGGDLSRLGAVAGNTEAMKASLGEVGSQLAALDTISAQTQPLAPTMTSLGTKVDLLTAEMQVLAEVQTQSAADSLEALEAVTTGIEGMSEGIEGMGGSLTTVAGGITDMTVLLEGMTASLDGMEQELEQLNGQIGDMAETMDAMCLIMYDIGGSHPTSCPSTP